RPLTFESANTTLDARAQSSLSDVASELQAHPEIKLVEIQGHSDERGDATTNARLARTRATAALDFLAGKGVSRSRLRAAGYGATCPADPSCRVAGAPPTCHEASSFDKDRRVPLLVVDWGSDHFKGKTCETSR